jgi:cob(I)alamin adenosyltransferase
LFEAVGAVDEASSVIGMARALVEEPALAATLRTVQEHLVRLMAHLAATPEARQRYPGPDADMLQWVEARIADLQAGLPPLRAFVLPGDTLPGAALHVARTTVRRAERRVVALAEAEPGLEAASIAYLNRLASLLFVAALYVERAYK